MQDIRPESSFVNAVNLVEKSATVPDIEFFLGDYFFALCIVRKLVLRKCVYLRILYNMCYLKSSDVNTKQDFYVKITSLISLTNISQMSSKSILIISSYTVSKLVHFLSHSVED